MGDAISGVGAIDTTTSTNDVDANKEKFDVKVEEAKKETRHISKSEIEAKEAGNKVVDDEKEKSSDAEAYWSANEGLAGDSNPAADTTAVGVTIETAIEFKRLQAEVDSTNTKIEELDKMIVRVDNRINILEPIVKSFLYGALFVKELNNHKALKEELETSKSKLEEYLIELEKQFSKPPPATSGGLQ